MASAINYNTVWTSIFEPVSTFGFLQPLRRSPRSSPAKHDQPYHVVGSDLAGVVLRVGPGVTRWQPGDEVVAHCLSVELEDPQGHDDTMMDPQQRIWGFETNFGGLAELALVKSNQLMPKAGPPDLGGGRLPRAWSTPPRTGSWSASNGADMKQGDVVLIWGASGGLGSATPPSTRSTAARSRSASCPSPDKAELCRADGRRADHRPDAPRATGSGRTASSRTGRSGSGSASRIRELTGGDDVDIVFEHPGRETFGASVYVARRGGTIVTCASTSGFMHEYDNRYLWMNLKRIIGSHFANYRESWEANRLIAGARSTRRCRARTRWSETGQAAYDVHRNLHQGKVGVLCLAPEEGLGVRDPELRAEHLADDQPVP